MLIMIKKHPMQVMKMIAQIFLFDLQVIEESLKNKKTTF